jgi:hypothetical protein
MKDPASSNLENLPHGIPHAQLEMSLIEEFLASKGYQLKDLEHLPKDIAKAYMAEACISASSKLAEIENRSRFVNDLFGGV